jgi:lipoyl(octanoyl) transferase
MNATSSSAARSTARGLPPRLQPETARACIWEDLGRMEYREAWDRQLAYVEQLKQGEGTDRLLFVEHPHVVTLGRNAHMENVLVSPERMAALGIELHETDRGGDVTYHGPGQIVAYPILDLTKWKRDVAAYLRALEEVLILALADFGLEGERSPGATGVWVGEAKVAAMGVHLSRWITSHGFALNVTPDLSYFGHIVPCGLTRPVTSMEKLIGAAPDRAAVRSALVRRFGQIFERTMTEGTQR